MVPRSHPGSHIHLHFVSPEGSPTVRDGIVFPNYRDGIVLHFYSDSPDVPDHLMDIAFYNPKKVGDGILGKIDFLTRVKHKNHDDIAAGKELFYYTWPSEDWLEPVGAVSDGKAAPEVVTDEEPSSEVVTDEEVYLKLHEAAYAGKSIDVPHGATLQQFIDALNKLIHKEREDFESAKRVAGVEEQAISSLADIDINPQERLDDVVTNVEAHVDHIALPSSADLDVVAQEQAVAEQTGNPLPQQDEPAAEPPTPQTEEAAQAQQTVQA